MRKVNAAFLPNWARMTDNLNFTPENVFELLEQRMGSAWALCGSSFPSIRFTDLRLLLGAPVAFWSRPKLTFNTDVRTIGPAEACPTSTWPRVSFAPPYLHWPESRASWS